MKRRPVYLLLMLICLALCVLIVLRFSNDLFIRGWVGDFIVVVLIYFFVKSIIDIKSFRLAIATLVFSYLTEFFQYLSLVKQIGLEQSRIAQIIVGTTFDFNDLVAYTIGVVCVYLLDITLIKKRVKDY